MFFFSLQRAVLENVFFIKKKKIMILNQLWVQVLMNSKKYALPTKICNYIVGYSATELLFELFTLKEFVLIQMLQ